MKKSSSRLARIFLVIVLVFLVLFFALDLWRLTFASARSDFLSSSFSKQMNGMPIQDISLISTADHGCIKVELWELHTPSGRYYQLSAWITTPIGLWYSAKLVGNTQSGSGAISPSEIDDLHYFIFRCGFSKFQVKLSSTNIPLSKKR